MAPSPLIFYVPGAVLVAGAALFKKELLPFAIAGAALLAGLQFLLPRK